MHLQQRAQWNRHAYPGDLGYGEGQRRRILHQVWPVHGQLISDDPKESFGATTIKRAQKYLLVLAGVAALAVIAYLVQGHQLGTLLSFLPGFSNPAFTVKPYDPSARLELSGFGLLGVEKEAWVGQNTLLVKAHVGTYCGGEQYQMQCEGRASKCRLLRVRAPLRSAIG